MTPRSSKRWEWLGENGGLICMHAENGVVIDAIVKKALAEGKTWRRNITR